MAKLDWKKLEQAFRREHVKTGIKLQDWCRQNNISYDTARRYIKLRKHSPRNTEKSAQKNAQIDDQKSAQKSDGNSSHDEPSGDDGCDEKCANLAETKRTRGSRLLPPSNAFSQRNTHAVRHRGYPAKAKELRTGTLNAVSDECIIFDESTAEGVGGDFYEMSNRAQEITASGLALTPQDYKFHFYAWWQDLKYSARVPESGLKLSREKTAYFSAVEKAMNITLTDEQKHWYICKETEQREEMKQEFPSTPQEAFLTSGRRVFSAESTLQAESFCSPPLIVYDIEPVTGTKTKAQSLRDGNKAEQHRTLMNYLLVWELPDPDEEYVCGADTAEGLEHGDRSSLDIIRCSNGEQVAHWFGHLDAELFAHLIAQVCRMYNNAFVGPERNNHGHAVILKLRELYPTRYIYNEQHLDQAYDDDTPRLGWLTTRQSKPVLTEGMKTLLNNGLSGIRWTGTLSEMNTYVYDAKGSMNAQEGCFDDQLMSYMIAQEMRARMPVRVRQKTDKRRTTHWMAH